MIPAATALERIRKKKLAPGYALIGRQVYWRDQIWWALREAMGLAESANGEGLVELDLKHSSLAGTAMAIAKRKRDHDPLKAFTAVGMIAETPYILMVHPGVPASNIKDFIAMARSQPGKINVGSSGNGGGLHLTLGGRYTNDKKDGSLFIVNNAPRAKISLTSTKGTPWTDEWHHARVVRDLESGKIEVFFDDMTAPVMTANDKTFPKGKIGVGSFDDRIDVAEVILKAK